MQINLSPWDYYPKNDKQFLDPLYRPYTDEMVVTSIDGVRDVCPVNKYKLSLQGKYYDPLKTPQENKGATLHKDLVRTGRGMSFQLMFPEEPCPVDFVKDESTGYCHRAELPVEGTLYTKDAFVPRHQHFNGHTNGLLKHRYETSTFDRNSINPHTGNHVMYHRSKHNSNRLKYNHLPMTSSLLGNI